MRVEGNRVIGKWQRESSGDREGRGTYGIIIPYEIRNVTIVWGVRRHAV